MKGSGSMRVKRIGNTAILSGRGVKRTIENFNHMPGLNLEKLRKETDEMLAHASYSEKGIERINETRQT